MGQEPRVRGGEAGADGEGLCRAPAMEDPAWRRAAAKDAWRKAPSHLSGVTGPTKQAEGSQVRMTLNLREVVNTPHQGVDLNPIPFYRRKGEPQRGERRKKTHYKCSISYIRKYT